VELPEIHRAPLCEIIPMARFMYRHFYYLCFLTLLNSKVSGIMNLYNTIRWFPIDSFICVKIDQSNMRWIVKKYKQGFV